MVCSELKVFAVLLVGRATLLFGTADPNLPPHWSEVRLVIYVCLRE